MRTIERSDFCDESGAISLENRLRATLRFGLRWFGEMQDQEWVSRRLSGVLSNDYVLVRNLTLPGAAQPVPLVLVGPQGVRVLVATSVRGVFRAKGEEWLTFRSGAGRFRRVRPNQQAIALGHAEAVHRFLQGQGFPLPEVEAMLVFTNPRTHVDTARPRARIVLADGLEHMAANLTQLRPIMDQEDIESVLGALQHARLPGVSAGDEPVTGPGGRGHMDRALGRPTGPPSEPGVSGVDLERRLWAEPTSRPAFVEEVGQAEERIEEAPFDAADILPTLERGVRASVPRISQGVERLDRQVVEAARRGTRRLPRLSSRQWVLLGFLLFGQLLVLIVLIVVVLGDVLFG